MIIGVPKELQDGENRVAAIPTTVKEYIKNGMEVYVETSAGNGSFISDEQYQESGAKIVSRDELYSKSDIIIKVNSPVINDTINECNSLKDGSIFKIQPEIQNKQLRYSKKEDFNEEVVKLFLNKQVDLNSKKFDKKLFKEPYILKSK